MLQTKGSLSSQLNSARFLLYSHPTTYFTGDKIIDTLGLSISMNTLGPKLRLYERQGILVKSYYYNQAGRKIVHYRWNTGAKK